MYGLYIFSQTKMYRLYRFIFIFSILSIHFFYIIYTFLFGYNTFGVHFKTILYLKPSCNEQSYKEFPVYSEDNIYVVSLTLNWFSGLKMELMYVSLFQMFIEKCKHTHTGLKNI